MEEQNSEDDELARAIAASLAMLEEATAVASIASEVQLFNNMSLDDVPIDAGAADASASASRVYGGSRIIPSDASLFNVESELVAPAAPASTDSDAWYSGLRARVASADLASVDQLLTADVRALNFVCLCSSAVMSLLLSGGSQTSVRVWLR